MDQRIIDKLYNEIYNVGQDKYIGNLAMTTLTNQLKATPDILGDFQYHAEKRGYGYRHFKENDTYIPGGSIFMWDRARLQEFINHVLAADNTFFKKSKCPTNVDEFAAFVAANLVDIEVDPMLHMFIAECFNGAKYNEPGHLEKVKYMKDKGIEWEKIIRSRYRKQNQLRN